jgi:hypothetical protein
VSPSWHPSAVRDACTRWLQLWSAELVLSL